MTGELWCKDTTCEIMSRTKADLTFLKDKNQLPVLA
jgi:hypothetical protein